MALTCSLGNSAVLHGQAFSRSQDANGRVAQQENTTMARINGLWFMSNNLTGTDSSDDIFGAGFADVLHGPGGNDATLGARSVGSVSSQSVAGVLSFLTIKNLDRSCKGGSNAHS